MKEKIKLTIAVIFICFIVFISVSVPQVFIGSLLGLLIFPPVLAFTVLLKEGVPIILKELRNQNIIDSGKLNLIISVSKETISLKPKYKIVGRLETSSSRFDQELIMFMSYLRSIKNTPDVPLSLTFLGRRVGKSLIREYEKENGITNWNLENFQNVLEIFDSKLHRESEWKLEGNNLIYTIKKCNIATKEGKFDLYACYTIRETFRGAMNYAFGNKAKLKTKKLLTRGDKFCEVVIQLP